jgi:hypothetical protein
VRALGGEEDVHVAGSMEDVVPHEAPPGKS